MQAQSAFSTDAFDPHSSNWPEKKESRYRPEIDGLRAFAVIAVIANHFDSHILPSGYLGVDIFFVISGFVITSSLSDKRPISFLDFISGFYERRIRRLLPALLAFVLITSVLICFFAADPGAALNLGWRSLLGISNIYLYQSSTDYFAHSTALNPFTHTWSLGVEEQFYLFFPFLIWFSGFAKQSAKGARNLFFWMGSISIASLLGFIYLYRGVNQPAAYFLMPPRFWEMAIGSLVFISLQRRAKLMHLLQQFPALIVVVAMVGVMFMPVSKAVYATILMVVLSAILLGCLRKGTVMYTFFTLRKVTYLGLISYSLYLWHWGLLSIGRWTIGIHWWSAPLLAALILLMAMGSYQFLETPLRRAQWSSKRGNSILIGILLSTSCAAFLDGYQRLKPISLFLGSRLSLAATGVGSLSNSHSLAKGFSKWIWKGKQCILEANYDVGKDIRIGDCTLGDFANSEKRILVLGNSFSAAFVHAFDRLVLEKDFAVIITSSTGASAVKEIPNNGAWSKANNYYWQTLVPRLVAQLRAGDIVFLVNDMAEFSPVEKTREHFASLTLLQSGLTRFSGDLKSRGIKLAILNGIPLAREALCSPELAAQQWFSPLSSEKCKMPDRATTLARRKDLDKILYGLEDRGLIKVVDLLPVFCPLEQCTYYSKEGLILYRDEYSHPSVEAARLSGEKFSHFFATFK